ncbi:MAG TPA: histidine phosphatase family protein [Ruminococcaceae bacterium]|nr:histidine phosphatase family protein [Oscillospiraceae bacterium]
MKTYKIHLIRHALTSENTEGKYIGQTDVPASEDGLKQIKNLMGENEGYPYAEVVISSPLKRCLQTAKLIYPDKEPVIMNDLTEYDFGDFEGCTAEELKDLDTFKTWLAGTEPDTPVPFGESQSQFNKRICECFVRIVEGIMKAGTESTAIITHGGIIMSLMSKFAIPEAQANEWLTPNGCGYTLRLDPTVWRMGQKLEAFAECPPIPQQIDAERDMWDTFSFDPDNDDYDISELINDYTDYESLN